MAKGKLTGKQAKFIEEYLIDMNATQAAIRAGYSRRSAHYMGFDTLRNPKVQEGLAIARQEASVKAGITPEMVIKARGNIAFFDIAECYTEDGNLKNIHDIPKETRLAMAGLESEELFAGRGDDKVFIGHTKKVKFWDKNRALEALEKHFGLYDADNSQKNRIPFSMNIDLSGDE